MKKRLYIIINSLICGGAEKSLVSFLNELDFNKFEVYLQMFNPTGDFMIFYSKNTLKIWLSAKTLYLSALSRS